MFEGLQFNPPTASEFKVLGNNILNKASTGWNYAKQGASTVGGFLSSGLSSLTHTQKQQDILNYGNGNKATSQDVYNYWTQKGLDLGTYDNFVKDQEAMNAWGNQYASEKTGNMTTGSWGTEFTNQFDLGKTLGSAQNIVNLGTSGWGLYETVAGYKDRKDLMKKNLEYADQMLTENRENLAHLRKERARQDTMRSNVSAQRSSESSVRSF